MTFFCINKRDVIQSQLCIKLTARHCAALRGVRTVRSLSNDYAALLSACPGVRYQTVFIDIHYSETFGLKIYYKFSLEYTARFKGHIMPPEHFLARLLK